MRWFTVQIDPPITLDRWSPQFPGDVPHWLHCVKARSAAEALALMQQSYCKGMPMRVLGAFG
jgi:hypothetical protein